MSDVTSDVGTSAACPLSQEDQSGLEPGQWRGHLQHFQSGTTDRLVQRLRDGQYEPISSGSVFLGDTWTGDADVVVVVLATPKARAVIDRLPCAPKTSIERHLTSDLCQAGVTFKRLVKKATVRRGLPWP